MSFSSWLRNGKRSLERRSPLNELLRSRPAIRPVATRLCLEPLEDRTLLSSFLVTNTGDNGGMNPAPGAGTGTLRQAIVDANADATGAAASPDLIQFNIPTSDPGYNSTTGAFTIEPLAPVPTITDTLVLDGYTQPGASPNTNPMGGSDPSDNAVRLIVLDGSQAGPDTVGLPITGANSTIRGLVVQNFGFYDIAITGSGASGNVIEGDYIRASLGVLIIDASGNTVGGTVPGARNVIADGGIDMGGGSPFFFGTGFAEGNVVEGNYIGLSAQGSTAVTPGGSGVWLVGGAENNRIGGTSTAERNVISGWGNDVTLAGPLISGGNPLSGNLVEGNYIGTDASGSVAASVGQPIDGEFRTAGIHGQYGVTVGGGANNNLISGNLISGCDAMGILIARTGGVQVQDNLIGTAANGTGALPNGIGIVDVLGTNDVIGGTAQGAGNVIAYNQGPGVVGGTATVEGNTIAYNQGPGVIGGVQVGSAFIPGFIRGGPIVDNSIHDNTGPGVWVVSDPFGSQDPFGAFSDGVVTGTSIQRNSIYGNGGLGISLGDIAVDANGNPLTLQQVQDSLQSNPGLWDHDEPNSQVVLNDSLGHVGANNFQNFPVLTSASSSSTGTSISGTFSEAAEPNTALTLDFYANPAADPSGYGQGQMYLGSAQVTTDANGNPASSPDGSAVINSDGSFTVTLPTPVLVGQGYLTATATDETTGDTSEFSPDLNVPAANLAPVTSQSLQALLGSIPATGAGGGTAVAFQATDSNQADAVLAAVNGLAPQPAPGTTVTLDLAPGAYTDLTASPPAGVTLVITGNGTTTTIVGQSPALTVTSGKVIVTGVALSTATDAPTILVSGGSLMLRNDTVQESTGYTDAAINVTAGTVNLGTASDPGGNTIIVNGAGTFLRDTTANPIAPVGDTFEMTVTTNSSLMLAGNNPPPLTGSVNGTPFTGTITYPTGLGSSVIVTLSTAATSASAIGQYPISAQLSAPDDGNSYVISPVTSTTGRMYVVSVGADPDGSGAKAVTFWDNKGNARLISAAALSSLDALNLVTQGGSAFDPHSVAQLQAWLSVSPNATAAYRLAVQLAAMDLNVLAGYVQATDLVFAGGLLPYATADHIAGLTSGGFIDVQDLMQAANATLALVKPGNPSVDPNAAYELALAQALQAANSNSDFVTQELFWGLLGL